MRGGDFRIELHDKGPHELDQRLADLPGCLRMQLPEKADLEVHLVDDMIANPLPVGKSFFEPCHGHPPRVTFDILGSVFRLGVLRCERSHDADRAQRVQFIRIPQDFSQRPATAWCTVIANRVRDDADFHRHFDYIHYNPVKHGLVSRVKDWPFSTFHRFVRQGIYPDDWGGNISFDSEETFRE